MWNDWKWEDARKELLYAIQLNPNYSYGHFYYSHLLQILGEDKEARTQINLALDLDPRIAIMRTVSASYYYWEGLYKESVDESERAIEIDSSFYGSYYLLFLTYLELHEDIKALEALQETMRLISLPTKDLEIVREIFNKSGLLGIFNWEVTSQLKPMRNKFYKAIIFSKLGDREGTLNCLEKGVERKSI